MRSILIMCLALAGLSSASAETIQFDSDSDILVIRGFTTVMGWVQFDIIGSRGGTALCVALDKTGKPVATTTGYANVGYVAFVEIELDQIDKVACKYNS